MWAVQSIAIVVQAIGKGVQRSGFHSLKGRKSMQSIFCDADIVTTFASYGETERSDTAVWMRYQ